MTKDRRGDSVLHIAAGYGRLDVLKYLLDEVQSNPVPTGFKGSTPLHGAAEAGHLSTVEYLVGNHQINPLDQDAEGASSLHRVCHGGNLKEKIFSDSTSHKITPALKGHIDIIKYIL